MLKKELFAKLAKTIAVMLCLCTTAIAQLPYNTLAFDSLPRSWDEGLPLGNGMQGALIWQKGNSIRFSLDRADLWDQRPMKGLHREEFSYKWIQQQVTKKEYAVVQQYFDRPYDYEPAPTKIPGAAIEINTKPFGKVVKAKLDLYTAVSSVKWAKGQALQCFVNAAGDFGMIKLQGAPALFPVQLLPPAYEGKAAAAGNIVGGDDLTRLGYKQGEILRKTNAISYLQNGWGGFQYRVTVCWKYAAKNTVVAAWRITSLTDSTNDIAIDTSYLQLQLATGFDAHLARHKQVWAAFWNKSSIQIPDSVLQRQWYLEQYKFKAASFRGAPPISLQAVWTADNGRIAPWKGDFHHDLNTQLSYWPAYSSNHLDEAMIYLDHLEQNKENYRRYTKQFFESDGIAVPGVTTLDGTEMGGWIQYSLSPTVACWLAQHYDLQWRYSMDKVFLASRAYPWVKEVATFIVNITVIDSTGKRKLPISSSPEIHDNYLTAWFNTNTNYDLALMKYVFATASNMATVLGIADEASKWKNMYNSFGDYAVSANDEMMFAASTPYAESHRHFSHLMAIHPLGLMKWEDGPKSQRIIKNSLQLLDSIGPAYWCGYSYAWEGNLKARAKDGDGAAKALRIFATAFCLPNSFHVNGDQSGKGYSSMTYRPFTLEGNFAFAAGLQEMLIQSYAGFIEIMPAVPAAWKDVTFKDLRTEGAFLVSAQKQKGVLQKIIVRATADGFMRLKLPADDFNYTSKGVLRNVVMKDGFMYGYLLKDAEITLVKK